MKKPHRLKVKLTLVGPILTRGGQTPQPGIDAPLARDPFGRPLLPFSLVKGKVRDAFRHLNLDPAKLGSWLGQESASGSWEPDRGRLRFGDFVALEWQQDPTRTHDGVIERIQLDHTTGATAGRMLAMVESPFAYGEEVTFTGTIEFIADDAEAKQIAADLERAMKFVPAYGAYRTVGFGRTKDVKVVAENLKPTAKGNPGGDVLPVRLALDRPLCIVGKKHARNHFESLDCIPGAVLKGATARLLLELAGSTAREVDGNAPAACAYPHVWKHLASIRFAEARPMSATATVRPVAPPLSTVMVGQQRYDVALEPQSRLIGDMAPAFAPDWKYEQEAVVQAAFGWIDLPRERRTRTAIDEQKGKAADEQLFSYGLVLPKTPDQEIVWETVIGLHGIPADEREAVRSELAKLFAFGLPNIGKTRAVATVEWRDSATTLAVSETAEPNGVHVVTLQTPHLMTNPKSLQSGKELKDVYQEFWDDVAPNQFRLERFFARQSLHGGYLRKRFAGAQSYEPYLLTDRGSTFVLKEIGADAATKLQQWRDCGLPLPAWAKSGYTELGKPLWQTCPFLPEVGFGEVAINLACHTEAKP